MGEKLRVYKAVTEELMETPREHYIVARNFHSAYCCAKSIKAKEEDIKSLVEHTDECIDAREHKEE